MSVPCQVWEWKASYGGRIVEQIRRVGASVDWSQEVFTLDEARSSAVTHAFVTLFERGLMQRRSRMVNWCPHLRTVISDIEVEVLQVRPAVVGGCSGRQLVLLAPTPQPSMAPSPSLLCRIPSFACRLWFSWTDRPSCHCRAGPALSSSASWRRSRTRLPAAMAAST